MDNGINKTEDVGRFLENKLNKKNSCSSYNSYFDEKENIYNIHNDNEIENDINSVKNKENDIPINEIILDNGKRNITIYQRKNNTQKEKIISNIKKISNKKIIKSTKALLLDLGNNQSKNGNQFGIKREQMVNLKNKLRQEIISELKEKAKEKKN